MDKNCDKISVIKKRILEYIDFKGITKYEFCKKSGISYGNLTSKSLKSEIGGEQISKILLVYSEISPKWLLLGEGEMIVNNEDPVCGIIHRKEYSENHIINDMSIQNDTNLLKEISSHFINIIDEKTKLYYETKSQLDEANNKIKELEREIKELRKI